MKKKGLLLSVALLTVVGMVSCGNKPGTSGGDTSVSESSQYTVTISNKEALTATWHVGEENRTLEIATEPRVNVNQALADGSMTVVSSDPSVLSVSGKVLTAVAAGSATVTVTYEGASDTVTVEVLAKETPITRWGTSHLGTEEDPFTSDDAVKVAEAVGETATTEKYYVKGEVSSFRDAPSSYGNVSYLLKSATGGKEFLVYRVKLGENGDSVTDEHIWVGGTATAYVSIVNYKGTTPESSSGYLVKCEGEKPRDPVTINATVAEAIQACKDTGENKVSYDKYAVTGYIVAKDAQSFYMSDTKGAAEIDKANQFQVYNYASVTGVNADEMVIDAKVKVTATVTYYKSSTSDNYAYETKNIDSIEVLDSALVAATGLSLGEAFELEVGATKTLTPTFAPENAKAETLTWATDNAEVATVANGKVTAVAVGTATITATSENGLTASVAVTVKAASDHSGEESKTATMALGTKAYDAVVSVNGTEKTAVKLGTSSATGDMTITVGAGATSVTFYAAAWKGATETTVTVAGGTTATLTADDGMTGNGPFTLNGSEETYKVTVNLSGITAETALTVAGSARCVIWSASYTVAK